MSLALCPQVVSQAPQHVIYSETQATCDIFLAPARLQSAPLPPLPPDPPPTSLSLSLSASLSLSLLPPWSP